MADTLTKREVLGHLVVILARLDALKAALDAQPGRTPEVEFQYDRVLRATTKLEALAR